MIEYKEINKKWSLKIVRDECECKTTIYPMMSHEIEKEDGTGFQGQKYYEREYLITTEKENGAVKGWVQVLMKSWDIRDGYLRSDKFPISNFNTVGEKSRITQARLKKRHLIDVGFMIAGLSKRFSDDSFN